MDQQPSPRLRPLLLYILAFAAFGTGVLAERSGWLPGSRPTPAELGQTFRPFWEAWNLASDRYVDRSAIDPQRMTRGAIRGMLAALGDFGHTTYLTPEELRKLEEGLKGELEGIGATLTIRKRRPTVMQVLPNSPARAAGLRPGDVFLEVNAKPVSDLSLDRIVTMVRGPAGTTVSIRLHREGEANPIDLQITRARVDVAEVTWQRLEGEPIAHVAVRGFGRHTDTQLKSALRELRRLGVKGLLLDFRGNPGGLKEQAIAVSSEFLKSGDVFLEEDARGQRKAIPVRPGGEATEVPLVVLIDEGTASSAEIFAGAIQDHGRGKLVGTRTFGTGTVLQPFGLSDGSAVLLATAQWLTPTGLKIWHQGISPDIEVALPESATVLLPNGEPELSTAALARTDDAQFLKGLAILRKQLR
ncbi:MAG TPA: S41 family peptidase [Gemmataceae bacterium]|nr:S41 family peptidase [Gemmataceae bacterium]